MGLLEVAPSECPLTVLYGSQTGTAQEVAERIYWAARRRGFQPDISAMDYFPRDQLPGCRLVVFVVSTTGAGEPPDNMRSLWCAAPSLCLHSACVI